MDRQYVDENNKSRERLRKLVNEMTEKELNLVIYKEGLTVAALLGHIAFWDERRRVMLKKWKRNGVTSVPAMNEGNTDIINDALLPLLLAIPPRQAAELSILTTEALDKELEELSHEMITAIEALKKPYSLNRAQHRKPHLDEIEAFLKAKRARK